MSRNHHAVTWCRIDIAPNTCQKIIFMRLCTSGAPPYLLDWILDSRLNSVVHFGGGGGGRGGGGGGGGEELPLHSYSPPPLDETLVVHRLNTFCPTKSLTLPWYRLRVGSKEG